MSLANFTSLPHRGTWERGALKASPIFSALSPPTRLGQVECQVSGTHSQLTSPGLYDICRVKPFGDFGDIRHFSACRVFGVTQNLYF